VNKFNLVLKSISRHPNAREQRCINDAVSPQRVAAAMLPLQPEEGMEQEFCTIHFCKQTLNLNLCYSTIPNTFSPMPDAVRTA